MALGIAAVAMGVLSFISWPVVIALGTIGAAIAGVLMWVFKWEEALTSVTGAFENMFLGVEERVETFAEFFKSVWEGMKVAAQEIWNGIASHFKSVWAASVNDFKSIWHSATGFFSGIWITAASIFRGIWNSIAGFFRGIWNSISSFITGVWNRIVSFLTEKWNSWTQSFSNATRIITDVLSGVGNSAYEVFNSMFIEPIKTIISYIQQAIEWIGNLGKAMSEAFESIQLPSFITEAFSSVGNIAIPGQGRGPLAPIARTMPLRQPQASAPYDTQSPVQRREVQQNTSLSAVRNPAAAAVKTGPTNITVNVPKAEIRSAPVMLDKSKIGEVVMQMIQLSTVRATE
jgi:phage-related protein